VNVPKAFGGEKEIDIYAKQQNIEELQGGGMVYFDIKTGNQQAAEIMGFENGDIDNVWQEDGFDNFQQSETIPVQMERGISNLQQNEINSQIYRPDNIEKKNFDISQYKNNDDPFGEDYAEQPYQDFNNMTEDQEAEVKH